MILFFIHLHMGQSGNDPNPAIKRCGLTLMDLNIILTHLGPRLLPFRGNDRFL